MKYFTKTWISYTGGVAKIAGPVALCLGMFFIEHFVGLGSLFWIWPGSWLTQPVCAVRAAVVNVDDFRLFGEAIEYES